MMLFIGIVIGLLLGWFTTWIGYHALLRELDARYLAQLHEIEKLYWQSVKDRDYSALPVFQQLRADRPDWFECVQ
jgi:hypothetical protein